MRARPGLVAWDGAEYATTATSLRHVLVEPSGRAGHCTIQLPAHIIQTGLSTGITWAAHLEAIRQRVCAEREGKGHVLAGVCYRRRPLVYRAAKRSCVALAARTPQHNWVPASSLTNKLSNARMPWLQRASAPGQLGRGELQGRALLGTHKRPRAPGLPRAARLRCMPASKRRDGAPEQGRRTYAGKARWRDIHGAGRPAGAAPDKQEHCWLIMVSMALILFSTAAVTPTLGTCLDFFI